MAPRVGSIDCFDPTTESLDAYLERLDAFFVANDLGQVEEGANAAAIQTADKKKVACMKALIGPKVYGTLQDLCKPAVPKDKTFTELCELLQGHFKPKRIEVAESFKFHRCLQAEDESVAAYSTRLRRMAATCNFGAFLDRNLRDQFVGGVKSKDTQRKLLEEDRDFVTCLAVATADEAALRESLLFSPHNASSPQVNYVKSKATSPHNRVQAT